VDRGCRDISGVLRPLLEGAEMSDDGRIADDESSRRAGIGVAFLHAVYTMYKRWNYAEKVSLSPTFRDVRRALHT
jgi:GNAT superfamily N-acetyltransferase